MLLGTPSKAAIFSSGDRQWKVPMREGLTRANQGAKDQPTLTSNLDVLLHLDTPCASTWNAGPSESVRQRIYTFSWCPVGALLYGGKPNESKQVAQTSGLA